MPSARRVGRLFVFGGLWTLDGGPPSCVIRVTDFWPLRLPLSPSLMTLALIGLTVPRLDSVNYSPMSIPAPAVRKPAPAPESTLALAAPATRVSTPTLAARGRDRPAAETRAARAARGRA